MYLQNNPDLNPLIIMDSNGIQSDTWVDKVKSFKNLKDKIKSLVLNIKKLMVMTLIYLMRLLMSIFQRKIGNIYMCEYNKGKGIKFAESSSFDNSLELYPHHAGAMTQDDYKKALDILIDAHEKLCTELKVNIPNKSILKEEALQTLKKIKQIFLNHIKNIC